MDVKKTLESLDFFTELAGIAIRHDPRMMVSIQAYFERRHAPRDKNTGSEVAKKGPKNLLTAAASVQAHAA